MSMNTYPLVDVGFLITPEIAAHINLSIDKQNGTVPDCIKAILNQFNELAKKDQLPEDSEYTDLNQTHDAIPDGLTVAFCSEFEGNCESMFPDKTTTPLDISYDNDTLLYIPFRKTADLFTAAYSSPDELLREIQTMFQEYGISLPESFNWWKHFVTITGTYFC